MYDFDKVINRYNTNSVKWEGFSSRYSNSDTLPMWVADMDFQSPKEVIDALTKTAQQGVFGYSLPSIKNKSVIAATLNWLKRHNEWKITQDDLGFAPGVIPALSFAIKSTTNENDAIIIQSPYYGHFKTLIEDSHRTLIDNPLIPNDFGFSLDFEDFEQKIIDNNVKAFILCNPHNPTGRVWSENELIKLARICYEHHVWILSDDIHSDLVMPGYNYQPIAKIFPKCDDLVITFKSISKTFNLAGLQIAYYISTNHDLLAKMRRIQAKSFVPGLENSFATPALVAAYKYGDRWLEEVIKYIEANYNYMDNYIAQNLPKAHLTNLEATYLTWLNVSYLGITEEQLQEKLNNSGIGVETSSEFGINDSHSLFIRINIATSRTNLISGLQRLVEALT